jgi:hypothetical protein
VTQTSQQPSERLTSRQRRIEEQRRKIEQHRRQQRQKRLVWGVGSAAVAAIAIALVVLLVRPPAAFQGHQVPIEGNRDHVPTGTALQNRNRPPSSGNHYDSTSGYGVFERDVPVGNWLHTLEHGGVVLLYRPDLCDQACIAQLREVYNSAPNSALFNQRKLAVLPYQDMDHKIAVVGWGYLDEMDEIDRDRILAFYRARVDQGPEKGVL